MGHRLRLGGETWVYVPCCPHWSQARRHHVQFVDRAGRRKEGRDPAVAAAHNSRLAVHAPTSHAPVGGDPVGVLDAVQLNANGRLGRCR